MKKILTKLSLIGLFAVIAQAEPNKEKTCMDIIDHNVLVVGAKTNLACVKKLVAEIPESNSDADHEIEIRSSLSNKCFSERNKASLDYMDEQFVKGGLKLTMKLMDSPCPLDIIEEMDEDPKKIEEEADTLLPSPIKESSYL